MAVKWRGTLQQRVRSKVWYAAALAVMCTVGSGGQSNEALFTFIMKVDIALESYARCAACDARRLEVPGDGGHNVSRSTAVDPPVPMPGNAATRRYAATDGYSPNLSVGPLMRIT